MLSKYAFYIRKKDGSLGQRLMDVSSVNILETVNAVGSWSIKSTTAEACPFEPGDGIIIVRDGSVYYTGVMKDISESYSAYNRLYTWTVKGVNDLDFLDRRVAYPDPATGDTDSVSHYTDTGTLAAVIKRLIDKNLGPSALADRQEAMIAATTIDDTGESVSVSLRFQTLLDVIVPLLDAQGYSIRPNWDTTTQKISYQIYDGVDRSSSMLFSTSLNSILTTDFTAKIPKGNYVISGGQGEDTSRNFAYASDADSIGDWGRIEYFHDMRSTAADDLQGDADSVLQQSAVENIGWSAEMNEDAYSMAYKTDWFLGDYITVMIRGTSYIRRVLQVKTSVSYSSETITPTIGTVQTGQLDHIFKQLSALRSDVNQLQWGSN